VMRRCPEAIWASPRAKSSGSISERMVFKGLFQ
jgi:hypothetical protein